MLAPNLTFLSSFEQGIEPVQNTDAYYFDSAWRWKCKVQKGGIVKM